MCQTPCLFPPQQKKKSNFNVKYSVRRRRLWACSPHWKGFFCPSEVPVSLAAYSHWLMLSHTPGRVEEFSDVCRSTCEGSRCAGALRRAAIYCTSLTGSLVILWSVVWKETWKNSNFSSSFFFFNIMWVKCINNICFWRRFHLFIALETQTLLTFLKGRFSNAVTYVTFLQGLETCFKWLETWCEPCSDTLETLLGLDLWNKMINVLRLALIDSRLEEDLFYINPYLIWELT